MLKGKKVKGRITILKALPYKKNMVYIRRVDDIYEWLLIFKNQLYSGYMVISPREGKKKLNKNELSQVTELLWAGATTTIDTLMGVKLSEKDKAIAAIVN